MAWSKWTWELFHCVFCLSKNLPKIQWQFVRMMWSVTKFRISSWQIPPMLTQNHMIPRNSQAPLTATNHVSWWCPWYLRVRSGRGGNWECKLLCATPESHGFRSRMSHSIQTNVLQLWWKSLHPGLWMKPRSVPNSLAPLDGKLPGTNNPRCSEEHYGCLCLQICGKALKFSTATVTNYHKHIGLEQHNFFFSYSSRSQKSKNGSYGLKWRYCHGHILSSSGRESIPCFSSS